MPIQALLNACFSTQSGSFLLSVSLHYFSAFTLLACCLCLGLGNKRLSKLPTSPLAGWHFIGGVPGGGFVILLSVLEPLLGSELLFVCASTGE